MPRGVSPRSSGACLRSAQTLDCNAGNELCELSEIVLIASDDEVAAERRGGDDGGVDRVGPTSAGEQFARALGKLRCQRLDATELGSGDVLVADLECTQTSPNHGNVSSTPRHSGG